MNDNAGEQTRQIVERERRRRNLALAGALGLLVLLFFVMTIVRLGGHVFD